MMIIDIKEHRERPKTKHKVILYLGERSFLPNVESDTLYPGSNVKIIKQIESEKHFRNNYPALLIWHTPKGEEKYAELSIVK